jgi:DNA-binding TFAR19-related protein (PDSD5 family)
LVELRQSIRALQRNVADSESRTVLSRARLVKPETGDETERKSIDQTVLDVGLIPELVRRTAAAHRSIAIEMAVGHQVE